MFFFDTAMALILPQIGLSVLKAIREHIRYGFKPASILQEQRRQDNAADHA